MDETTLEKMATTATPVAGDVLREIARAFEAEANVKTVFGDPIELHGHTVVPVATIFVSIGGGAGVGGATGLAKTVQGAIDAATRVIPGAWGGGVGGGVQVRVQPVGFIHDGKDGVLFSPIPHRDAA